MSSFPLVYITTKYVGRFASVKRIRKHSKLGKFAG